MNIVRTQKVNTNNAWGFGGKVGTYTFYDNGIYSFVGRNSHRHSGTSSANAVYVQIEVEFGIRIRKSLNSNKDLSKISELDSVVTIFVDHNEAHFVAVNGDHDKASFYGQEYKIFKKVII